MAKTATKAPTPLGDDEWRRRVSFDFGKGKGGMKEPAGFKDLTVGQTVTVLVTGKVNSLRTDTDSSNISLVMEKLELEGETKPKGVLGQLFDKGRIKAQG